MELTDFDLLKKGDSVYQVSYSPLSDSKIQIKEYIISEEIIPTKRFPSKEGIDSLGEKQSIPASTFNVSLEEQSKSPVLSPYYFIYLEYAEKAAELMWKRSKRSYENYLKPLLKEYLLNDKEFSEVLSYHKIVPSALKDNMDYLVDNFANLTGAGDLYYEISYILLNREPVLRCEPVRVYEADSISDEEYPILMDNYYGKKVQFENKLNIRTEIYNFPYKSTNYDEAADMPLSNLVRSGYNYSYEGLGIFDFSIYKYIPVSDISTVEDLERILSEIFMSKQKYIATEYFRLKELGVLFDEPFSMSDLNYLFY